METTKNSIWKFRVNDLLNTMSSYSIMLNKINHQTHEIITEAIIELSPVERSVNIEQYKLLDRDYSRLVSVELNRDGSISVNDTPRLFADLDPYDKIQIAQALTSEIMSVNNLQK